MAILASTQPPLSLLGTPVADLLLKIIGTARDGQVVRLTAAKCTIGSAAHCTLRLRARGVRAVHALILRGPGGVVFRAWAPNSRVNGEPVADAVLEAGDRITIGPIELEVLAAEGPPADPFDAGRTVVLDRRPASRPNLLESAAARVASRPAPSESRQVTSSVPRPKRWRPRIRKLVEEVRKLREEIDRFEQAAPLVNQYALEAAQLRARLESIEPQHAEWQSELERLRAELDQRQDQLSEELATLDRGRAEIEAERRAWQAERETARRDAELAQQQAQAAWTHHVAQREAELDAAAQELERKRGELSELAQGRQDLDSRQAALAEHEAAVAARQADLERQAVELEERSAELVRREAELAEAQASLQRAQEELAACRSAFESQQMSAREELAAAREALAAAESECARAREQLHAEFQLLASSREEIESQGSRLADFEAELVAARQAIAALHESEQERLGERSAELERLAAELSVRELELAERLQAATKGNTEAGTDTVVADDTTAQASELQQLRQQLEGRESELAHREHLLAARVGEHQQQLEQVEAARRELIARAEELDLREAELAARPAADLTVEVAEQNLQPDAALAAEAELQRQREELEASLETLRQERESFAQERSRASDRLDAEARELAEAREQLDAEREQLTVEREAWESHISRSAMRSPAPVDDELEEDAVAYSEFSPARQAYRPMSPSDAETEHMPLNETLCRLTHADDEDSIESHIAAFMTRLRNGQPAPPPVVERTLPKRRKSDEPPPAPLDAEPADRREPASLVLDVATAPLETARRKAPEEKSSMNVLREIGLSHARSAIDTHGQRRSLQQAYVTLAISAACLAAAFFVLYMSGNAAMQSVGIVILVVGIYWMASSIWAANKVVATIRRRRRGGLRAMLEEVDAEIAAIQREAEAELAAAEQCENESPATE